MPGWLVTEDADGDRHVIPLLDRHGHDTDAGCWCGPRRDTEDRSVVIHNSADGREKRERQ